MERDDGGVIAGHERRSMMIDIICLGQLQLPPALMFVGMRTRVHLMKQMRLVGSGWFWKVASKS